MPREIYQRQTEGSNILAELVILDRDDANNPRYTRERPPGSVAEQRACNEQETAELLEKETDDLVTAARTRLAAFEPATATTRQVADCLADVLRILGIG